MLNNLRKDFLIAIASALTGALATFYIPKILIDDSVELEFAPFIKEKFINVPDLLGGRVEVSVDGNPQSNLSVLDVYLFNRSHKALKNIPITFEFYNNDGLAVPKLLGKQFKVPDTFPKDSVKDLSLEKEGYIRYEISSFPVIESYSTGFIASFVFLGEKTPKVKVQSSYADGKVISIYEYDKRKRERNELIQIFSALAVFIILFVGYLLWDSKRSRERFIKRLGDAAEALHEFRIDKDTLRKIAVDSYVSATKKTNKQSQSDV